MDKLREAARDDLEEQFPNFGRKLSDEVVDVFIVIRWSHLLNPDMVGGLSDGAKLLCEILEVNMKNIKIGIRRGSYETHRMWGDFSNSDEFGESNSAFAARSNGLIETLRGQNVDLRDRCKRVKGRSRQLADFGSEIGA
ncbi:MAG: hypothetical protein LBF42_02780, partial [Puniceicoccales bacterium]|nr:hypothetical protein [Puniceicoccales bacterium]